MTPADQDKLKDYVGLLKKTHGDLDKQIREDREKREESASGLESFDPTVHAEEAFRRLDTDAELSADQASGLEAIIDEDLPGRLSI
jgi:hypothetical protein